MRLGEPITGLGRAAASQASIERLTDLSLIV